MKKNGFTLIELLIVTVVIVTLMGIVFRLAGVGGDSRAKSKTQARLQRLENAISGYYAAYGSYTPVPLEGRSRDINVRVRERGKQRSGEKNSVEGKLYNAYKDPSKNKEVISQIDAACRAQPIAVLFPFFLSDIDGERKSNAEKLVTALATRRESNSGELPFSLQPLHSVGGLNVGERDEATLFQFGLLSFLMPRYLFMLQGHPEMYDTPNSQWSKNNQLPCRLDTGRPYETWESMQEYLYRSGGINARQAFLVKNLTSQAVCARWMPNFEGIVSGGLDFYGVDTSDGDWPFLSGSQYDGVPGYKKWLRLFSPSDNKSSSGGGGGNLYILNGMTVADGWGHEFYYYADPPYQSYRLWSAGANGYTFPPWLEVDSFSNDNDKRAITEWTKDDICHLSE